MRRRGDLTVWFDEEAIANWMADKTGKPGGQRVYSDLAIETSLVVRMVYKLAYRQTEGFLNSIASLLGLGIEIPDYSTLCRRSRLLRKKLRIPKAASSQPIHLMIDSTGLRIHVGTARKPPKQRAWRKLHIAVDRKTGNIVAWCFRCLLLVMCTYPFAKGALTLHLARREGHERNFDCNLMHRKVLASSHQHLIAEAPSRRSSGRRCGLERWRGNELNTELGARYSTRWLRSGCPIRTAPGDSATGVLALFAVGDVYVSLCKKRAYTPFSVRRRSRALFWL